MLQATFTLADIHPAAGAIDRGIHNALDAWQDWSDRTFCDIQPEVLSIIESLAYLVGYAAAMAWGFSRLACLNTWEAWLESAPNRAVLAEVMSLNWERARFAFSIAYSALAVAVVLLALGASYVLGNAPRWAGRAIGVALCVEEI